MVKFTSTLIAASFFACSAFAAPIFSRSENAVVAARSIGPVLGGDMVEYASRSPHNNKYNHPTQGYSQWVDALRTRGYGHGGGHGHPHNGQHPDGHGAWHGHGQGQPSNQPSENVERRSFEDYAGALAARRGGGGGSHHGW